MEYFQGDNTRYQGVVRTWDADRKFGFINYVNRSGRYQGIFFGKQAIGFDTKLSRAWAMKPGAAVTFIVGQGGSKTNPRHDMYEARSIEPLNPPEPIDLVTYGEVSRLIDIHPGSDSMIGWLARPCGDDIFFSGNFIRHEFRQYPMPIVGDYVWHKIGFNEQAQRNFAYNFELYNDEEQAQVKEYYLQASASVDQEMDNSNTVPRALPQMPVFAPEQKPKQKPEQKSEPQQVIKPVSLLDPATKDKSLLQIMLERRSRQ